MPSWWKIKRELRRIGRQIRYPFAVLYDIVITLVTDMTARPSGRRTTNPLDGRTRIAIYLIYPSRGLQKSHIHALEYMVTSGYAPFVISNLRLSKSDAQRVQNLAWHYLERPNLGYDFGGYRDGILALAPVLDDIERLVLFNDSCWFPLPGAEDWLATSEALGVDFAGASWHTAVDSPRAENYEDIVWHVDKSTRKFHYASFAWNVSGRLLHSPEFLSFWQKYLLSNNKDVTVRRGEMGLSKMVVDGNFSHAATTEFEDFDQTLAAMSDADLNEILLRMNFIMTSDKTAHWRDLIKSDGQQTLSRGQIEKLILTVTAHQGMAYTLADYLIGRKKFAFLKKSLLWLDEDGCRNTLALIAGFEGEFGDTLREEAQSMAMTNRG